MKTLKTTLVILTVIGIGTAALAQSSFLDKAKDVAKKKDVDKMVKKKNKGGKGTDDIAVKGTGVPTNATATKPAPTTTVTPAATNK